MEKEDNMQAQIGNVSRERGKKSKQMLEIKTL